MANWLIYFLTTGNIYDCKVDNICVPVAPWKLHKVNYKMVVYSYIHSKCTWFQYFEDWSIIISIHIHMLVSSCLIPSFSFHHRTKSTWTHLLINKYLLQYPSNLMCSQGSSILLAGHALLATIHAKHAKTSVPYLIKNKTPLHTQMECPNYSSEWL